MGVAQSRRLHGEEKEDREKNPLGKYFKEKFSSSTTNIIIMTKCITESCTKNTEKKDGRGAPDNKKRKLNKDDIFFRLQN